MASERYVQFSSPTWLRNLGFSSWLLVGFVLVIVGLIWLLAETSTIVMPVILATVLGAVAGPLVGRLEGHKVPRIWGAVLKSLVFFLAFAVLSTLFVLKDGPVMHHFINRHLGVPEPDANIVTTNIAKSLRSYFLAVTIIAAFNAILIGGSALILGVPLAGTIAVVTFVGAYVPFVGAWVAGGFAVLVALSTGSTSDAVIIGVVALLANGVLQQLIQPFVMGATLSLNPLVVLVVTIGAGALFGMVGLTLAAPLTSAAVHISNDLRARSNGTSRGQPAPSG
jgi:putative heme transporter